MISSFWLSTLISSSSSMIKFLWRLRFHSSRTLTANKICASQLTKEQWNRLWVILKSFKEICRCLPMIWRTLMLLKGELLLLLTSRAPLEYRGSPALASNQGEVNLLLCLLATTSNSLDLQLTQLLGTSPGHLPSRLQLLVAVLSVAKKSRKSQLF